MKVRRLLWGLLFTTRWRRASYGGGYALGNSDLDACGEHGNIDSEVCYEDPLIYPLPNSALGMRRVLYLGGGISGVLSPNHAQTPRYTPSQIVHSAHAECTIWEGVCKYSFSVLGTYFYIVKQRMGTRILRYYSMLSGT